jgi:TetR/AcrR family transcriptional regulator, cholesterol catabolism regulator
MPENDIRSRILDAATRLFTENGFAATSVRAIGNAAGVSQSSLYHHTGAKGQILADIHQGFVDDMIERLRAVEEEDTSAIEQIRGIIRVVLAAVGSRQAEVTVFLREPHAVPGNRKSAIQRSRDEVDAILDRILRRGIENGEIRPAREPRLMRLAIYGMCNWSYQWYRPDGSQSISEIADEFADMILAGIIADK